MNTVSFNPNSAITNKETTISENHVLSHRARKRIREAKKKARPGNIF